MSEVAEAPVVTTQTAESSTRKEHAPDPTRRLYEALRPSDEIRDKMRTRVEAAARVAYENDKDPETRHLLEVGTGIFLWEMSVNETGRSLPRGLVFDLREETDNPSPYWNSRAIRFDKSIFSFDQYRDYIRILQKQGVLDEVTALREEHARSNQDEIAQAMEQVVRHSNLPPYFESLGMATGGKIAERELNSTEAARLQSTYDAAFIKQYGSLPSSSTTFSTDHDAFLGSQYRTDVLVPLQMATKPEREDQDPGAQRQDRARMRFRQHVTDDIAAHKGQSVGSRLYVDNGRFMLRSEDGSPPEDISNSAWWSTCSREIPPEMNDSIYWHHDVYPKHALQMIGPRLYDPSDARPYDVIIDEGIKDYAREFVEEYIREGIRLRWAGDDRAEELAWLTGAIGPVAKDDTITDHWYGFAPSDLDIPTRPLLQSAKRPHQSEPSDSDEFAELFGSLRPKREKLKVTTDLEAERLKKDVIAKVIFAEPVVSQGVQQRLMQHAPFNPNIPEDVAITTVDLLLQFSDKTFANDKTDPFIYGLKLVARKGDQYFFQVDPENNVYRRNNDIIPHDKRATIIDSCRDAGMTALADDIYRIDGEITVAQLIDLARNYVVWTSAPENFNFEAESLKDLAEQGLIGEDGIVRGQCDTLEFFLRKLVTPVYGEENLATEGGYAIQGSSVVHGTLHAQTRVITPEGDLDYILDIEPDPFRSERKKKDTQVQRVEESPDFALPESEGISSELENQVRTIEKKVKVDAAFTRFASMLSLYLDIPIPPTEYEAWDSAVLSAMTPMLNKGPDTWRLVPHIQIFKLMREHKAGEPLNGEDIVKMQEVIDHYRNRSEPLMDMIRQRTMPAYDPLFLRGMDTVLQALAA